MYVIRHKTKRLLTTLISDCIMETKYFLSKHLALRVDTIEDGTLRLTDATDGTPYINAGTLINCNGGIGKFLDLCIDEETFQQRIRRREYMSSPEYRKVQARKEAEREAIAAAQHKADFDALPSPIPVTYRNIGIVLRYLRDIPYGVVELPSMTMGYSFNQYDCDGKIAAALVLDDDLIEDGENYGRRFQVGAPHGHLTKYYRA